MTTPLCPTCKVEADFDKDPSIVIDGVVHFHGRRLTWCGMSLTQKVPVA